MGIFATKKYVWNEPWFFQQRNRETKAWMRFGLLLFVVGGIAFWVMASQVGNQPVDWVEVTLLSLAAPACLWYVLDGANTRRQAILYENEIAVIGEMGKYSQTKTYKLSHIADAAIALPEDSLWTDPALYFFYKGEEQVIGIERKAGLTRLAQALHDVGVPVTLKGWQPNQERDFERVFSWEADPDQVDAKARMEVLSPGTISMLTPMGIMLAIIRELSGYVISLIVIGMAIYYGYQNWNNMGLFGTILVILVPCGVVMLAGQYTSRIGAAASSAGLIKMAKGQFRKRDGIEIDVDADNVVPVSIITRDQFGKTVYKIYDTGLIQPDIRGRRILFEGKKQRWNIPARSIRSIAIEEVQTGTPGQSAMGMLQYYVVVNFVGEDGQEQEFGFRSGEVEYGNRDDVKRAQGGIRVYEAFESVVSAM